MRPKAALILPTPSPWLAQALQTQGGPGSGQRGPRLTRVAFGLLRVASFREDVIHDLGACGSHRPRFPAVDNLAWCTSRTPRRRRRSRGAMAGSGAEEPRRENAHRVPLTSAAPVTAKTAPSPNQPDTRSSPGRVTYAGRGPGGHEQPGHRVHRHFRAGRARIRAGVEGPAACLRRARHPAAGTGQAYARIAPTLVAPGDISQPPAERIMLLTKAIAVPLRPGSWPSRARTPRP